MSATSSRGRAIRAARQAGGPSLGASLCALLGSAFDLLGWGISGVRRSNGLITSRIVLVATRV